MLEKLKSLLGMQPSLYARVGGGAAMDAAVDIFYRKVLDDSCIRYLFEDVDMDQQRAKQKRFLSMVCGGPDKFTGLQMREAHAHLLALGLNDEHFDHIMEHLRTSLESCGVKPPDLTQILDVAESFREDVLGR
ncbi:group I truncated hemoglobin [Methylogaea oryzae]|uniref:Group 1 truncated hemoglobin n=1 Tax=Methylogaea oryzae TaxID=1295382 RepID=A0A8D4VNE9_9GAMM|nr:group 1 truncated hemoglobin [Methylogaea oryzae]BBL71408.1 group 1 truncated hemoglobin [Methylogaea oryzae]